MPELTKRSFSQEYLKYSWEEIQEFIYSATEKDVEIALQKSSKSIWDFAHLISPAADRYLEDMANQSHHLTRNRFGNTMQMYVPLYLSNECNNICTYCGFSMDNKVPRKTLTMLELQNELQTLKSFRYDHILLLTGEDKKEVGMEYFTKVFPLVSRSFSTISMEVQPLEIKEYETLASLGLYGVLVYQETYHLNNYKTHHPKGRKSNFFYRLETPDRLGQAGIHKIGIGALLGLEDWRVDSFFTALHHDYLKSRYWKSKYSISFPRLRPCVGGLAPKTIMTDRELVQLICAYRILDEDLELSISTRESAHFRNHIIDLGITSMSAGSKTNPGGYGTDTSSLEQFEVTDERDTFEIAQMLVDKGLEPVWKDWDVLFSEAH